MKCREIKSRINQGLSARANIGRDLLEHTESCENCRRYLALEGMTVALVKAYRVDDRKSVDDLSNNPYLMTKIKARIRELSEHGVGTWESAVLGLRGWLVAFGAAAALLVFYSVSGQYQQYLNRGTDGITLRDGEAVMLSVLNEDSITENTRIFDDYGRLLPDNTKQQKKATNK